MSTNVNNSGYNYRKNKNQYAVIPNMETGSHGGDMKIFFSVVFLMPFIFGTPQAKSAEWVSLGTALGDNKFYYDNESLTKLPNGIVKFWEKIEYSPKQRKEQIKWRTAKGYSITRYDTLSHTLNLIEVNCPTRESRTMMTVDYSSTFGSLDSNTFKWQPSEGWSPIIPDPMMESIFKAVCQSQDKK